MIMSRLNRHFERAVHRESCAGGRGLFGKRAEPVPDKHGCTSSGIAAASLSQHLEVERNLSKSFLLCLRHSLGPLPLSCTKRISPRLRIRCISTRTGHCKPSHLALQAVFVLVISRTLGHGRGLEPTAGRRSSVGGRGAKSTWRRSVNV